jgi:stage II sporulation protein AB (anti-sigma F factor)
MVWESAALEISIEDNLLARQIACEGRIAVRPESAGLAAARRLVSTIAGDLCWSQEDIIDLMLAVCEALSNAYIYGSPNKSKNLIYIGWKFADDVLTVVVEDEGPGFSPNDISKGPCFTDLHCGCGISLMNESVDEVDFDFNSGMSVALKKKRF